MNREDVIRLIATSATTAAEYVPVAMLLGSGYGCVGYFNQSINEKLIDSLVLLNARLVDLRADEHNSRHGRVTDFNDFLQDVVANHVRDESPEDERDSDRSEGTIPLTAVPLREIAILYPVAQIATLLKSARKVTGGDKGATQEVPTFLDFNNRSIVLKVLRLKIW